MSSKGRIVVIDDEVNAATALEALLRDDGYDVTRAHDARSGLQLIEKSEPDVVLTDVRMPGMDGVELLARIKETRPETMVVLMTAYGTVKTAVKAMKLGAEDFLSKPIDMEELEVVLQKTLEKKALLDETRVLRERLEQKYRLENLVGESPEMLAVFKTIRQVAPSSASVLLLGESGTGKELFAQALHQNSPRRAKPFIKVACAALPETLLESELFGHEKGSFTGAVYSRAGRFEVADGGTLFLDEIGDTSPAFQVKLLRALQEGEIRPVGSARSVPVDVRIIAATNRDLEADVASGRFRRDLYYRIAGIGLHMPPLRERPQDIPLIVGALFKESALAGRRFSDAAMKALGAYAWPGNVRELQNEVMRALALADADLVEADAFSPALRRAPMRRHAELPDFDPAGASLKDLVDHFEGQVLTAAMHRHKGNKTRVADELGLTRVGLRMKLARLGLAGGEA